MTKYKYVQHPINGEKNTELVSLYHEECFIPTKYSWIAAIKQGFLKSGHIGH